jgi:hypothetical protein
MPPLLGYVAVGDTAPPFPGIGMVAPAPPVMPHSGIGCAGTMPHPALGLLPVAPTLPLTL